MGVEVWFTWYKVVCHLPPYIIVLFFRLQQFVLIYSREMESESLNTIVLELVKM